MSPNSPMSHGSAGSPLAAVAAQATYPVHQQQVIRLDSGQSSLYDGNQEMIGKTDTEQTEGQETTTMMSIEAGDEDEDDDEERTHTHTQHSHTHSLPLSEVSDTDEHLDANDDVSDHEMYTEHQTAQ